MFRMNLPHLITLLSIISLLILKMPTMARFLLKSHLALSLIITIYSFDYLTDWEPFCVSNWSNRVGAMLWNWNAAKSCRNKVWITSAWTKLSNRWRHTHAVSPPIIIIIFAWNSCSFWPICSMQPRFLAMSNKICWTASKRLCKTNLIHFDEENYN